MNHKTPRPRTPAAKAFRRWVWTAASVSCLLLTSRLAWGWDQQRRYTQQLDRIAARGEPVFAHDLRLPPAPADPGNPAHRLVMAKHNWPTFETMTGDQPGRATIIDSDWWTDRGNPDAPPNPITDDARYLRDVEAAVRPHLDAARADTPGGFLRNAGNPLINTTLPHLGEQRRLARLLDDAADRATGLDDAEAVFRYVTDILVVAHRVEVGGLGGVIETRAVANIRQLAWSRLETALPRLTPPSPDDHATRDAARRLIALLLEHDPTTPTLTRVIALERVALTDALHFGLNHSPENRLDLTVQATRRLKHDIEDGWLESALRWWVRPVVAAPYTPVTRLSTDAQETLEAHDRFADQLARLPDLSPPSPDGVWASYLSATGSDRTAGGRWCAGLAALHHAHRARRRLAATALALWAHRGEHGRRPDTLDALVPDWLPAVPDDPFAPAGSDAPLRLHPTSPPTTPTSRQSYNHRAHGTPLPPVYTGPVLASLGPDLTDDAGNELTYILPSRTIHLAYHRNRYWTSGRQIKSFPSFGPGDLVFRLDAP